MQMDEFCQPECNSAGCAIEQYYCVTPRQSECAPGCTLRELYYGTTCKQECNNEQCYFGASKCDWIRQECAPGCGSSTLTNMKCDWNCNFEDCYYDMQQCSPRMCEVDQIMLFCKYGKYGLPGGNTDEFAVRSALYYEILQRYFFGTAPAGSPAYCDQSRRAEAFNNRQCIPECNTADGLYSMGMCATALPAHCVVGWGPEEGECFVCDTPQYFGHCVSACPTGTKVVTVFTDYCSNFTSSFTKESPAKLYVLENTRTSKIREKSLFYRFVDALVAAWEPYTVISLIGSEVTFDTAMADRVSNVDYITAWAFPDLFASGRWMNLTIQSLPCSVEQRPGCVETLTTLFLRRVPTISISVKLLTFKNVIITRKSYFFDTVKECPVSISEEESSSFFLRDCAQVTNFTLFEVGSSGTLTFDVSSTQHVSFEDISLRFKSLITVTTGTLRLLNSHFKNVQTTTAVVLYDCSSLADSCGTVSYEGGSVSYLNNARELGVGFSPFLLAHFAKSVHITSVEFQLCFASDALLLFREFKELVISDCVFRSNVVYGSILSIDMFFINYSVPVLLTSLKFATNYSKAPLVNIASSNFPRSVIVSGCSFEGNAGESAISVAFASAPSPSNSVQVSTSSFLSNSAFTELLRVRNFASVTVSASEFRDNGDHNDEEVSLEGYFSDPNTQASAVPALSGAGCSGLIMLEKCSSSHFDNLTVTDNRCDAGGTGIAFQGPIGHQTVVSSALFARNLGFGPTAIALHLPEGTRAEVHNFTALENSHSLLGVITLLAATQLLIADSFFQRNSVSKHTCISAQSAANLTVLRCGFEGNEAPLGDAAAIAFIVGRSEIPMLYLEVKNSTFSYSHALRGSAIAILTEAINVAVSLVLVQSGFYYNRASVAGASLYVDSDTDLSAIIEKCEFAYEESRGGAISIQNSRGSVTISHSMFRLNTGRDCSALCFDHGVSASLALEDSEFIGNSNAAIAKLNGQFTSKLQTLRCTFTGGQTAVSLQNTQWQDSFSVFSGSRTTAVSLTRTRAIVVGSEFVGNSAEVGGALRLSESELQCSECWLATNTAATHGGAVYVERQSSLLLLSCLLKGNTAGGQAAAVYSHSSSIAIGASAFIENVAGYSGTLSAVSSRVTIQRSRFSSNRAPRTSGLWLILDSAATVSDSLFSNQTGLEAAFFLLEISSSAIVMNCTFGFGSGWTAGAAFVSFSNLSISDSNFTHMEAQVAGVVYATSYGLIELTRVVTAKTNSLQGGVVHIRTGKLTVAGCYFAEYEGGAVNAEGVERVQVSQSSFEGGQGAEGSAVHCVKCVNVAISHTRFAYNRGAHGTLFVQSTLNYSVENSVFDGNAAEYGGAVFSTNSNFSIRACSFFNNSAISGGALNIACTGTCDYSVTDSVFEGNAAAVTGGAVQWNSVPPVFFNLTFRKNTAQVGPNLSSFLAKVNLFANFSGNHTSVIHEASPGAPVAVPLVAQLYDHYDQLLILDNSTTCKLRAVNESLATLSGTTSSKVSKGVVTFAGVTVSAEPKSIVALEVGECGGTQVVYSSRVEVRLRGCRPGESAAGRMCLLCERNSYSFDPSQPCKSCPHHCTCLGSTTVIPDSGYWRVSEASIDIRKCRNPSSCLGGSPEALSGVCAAGYEGHLCQVCSSGYYSAGNFRCIKCPSAAVTQGVLVVVGTFLIILVLVWASVHVRLLAVCLRILLSFFHTLYFVAEAGIEWPAAVERLLEGLRRAAAPFHTAVPVDCWLPTSYYSRLLAFTMLPGALALVVGALWLPVLFVTRALWRLRAYWLRSVAAIYFFVYPTLVVSSLSVFSCTELEAGEYWLTFDMNSRCWVTKHYIIIGTIGLMSLIQLGVPLALLYREKFLQQGLQGQYKGWEAVTHLRKLAMAAVTVLLVEKLLVQALALQLVLWAALVVHYQYWPYESEELNRLEFVSLSTSAMALWWGIFYYQKDSASSLVQVAVVGSISSFPLLWLRALCRGLKKREINLDSLIAVMYVPQRPLECVSLKSAYIHILRSGITRVPNLAVHRLELIERQVSSKVQPQTIFQ